jgi:tetratricopeptide (TPR) repeat protein
MRIVVALALALATCVGGVLMWLGSEPTTQLVDAAGKTLTAGSAEDVDASIFDEPRALIEAGDLEAARARLVTLLEEADEDGETCILLCEVTRRLEDSEAAVDYGLKAVELLPESAEAHVAYAQALGLQLMQSGQGLSAFASLLPRLDRLKEECATAIRLDPEDTEARTILASLHTFVPSFMGGDIDRAIELAQEVVERDPPAGKRLLALAYQRNEETERAVELLTRAIEEHPEERSLHVALAGIHVAEERFDEADRVYEAARAGERDELYYQALYGQARMRVDGEFELERAVELLDEFVAAEPEGEYMPSVARALWRKGRAHEGLGDVEAARAAYRECLRLEPELAEASKALEALEG